MERWGVRERVRVRVCVCVLWNCLFGRGQLQRLGADFAVNGINRKPHLQMQSVDG